MSKVTIVGAGNVGATAAHIIASKNLADVVLVDVAEGLPQGKALDMMHMRSVEKFTVKVTGTNDYAATADSDIVVITAGIARKPGMTREDLLGVNSGIMSSVIEQAMAASPNAIYICVTNPLDVMTYLAFKKSGLPSNRLMGMGGVLDSSRLSFAVCEKLGCDPADVTAWALGAHGEGMVCWPRFTTVKGTPITELMSEEDIAEVTKRCTKGGAEVVSFLKTGSAYYAPGASIAKMVEAILTDSKEVLSVCAYIDGQYGLNDLYMNIPVRLGKGGVEEIVEFDRSSFYNSLYNSYLDAYHTSLGLATSSFNFAYNTFNSRTTMEALAGVKYFLVHDDEQVLKPPLYDKLALSGEIQGNKYKVYEASESLPLAFCYADTLSREEYDRSSQRFPTS